MSRPPRGLLPLLVAGLLPACAAREPVRPAASPASSPARAQGGAVESVEREPPLSASRYSLMNAKLVLPPLPVPNSGVTPVPLATTDPRYAEYFADIRKRIEEKWVYPPEASRKGQAGKGEVQFVLNRDGSVRSVETVKSSGVTLLDRYIEQAIRLAGPFPPIPAFVEGDVLPISIDFTYVLRGFVNP